MLRALRSLLENSPWTAGPESWYILTSLTESLYLEWFMGGPLELSQSAKAASRVARSVYDLADIAEALQHKAN